MPWRPRPGDGQDITEAVTPPGGRDPGAPGTAGPPVWPVLGDEDARGSYEHHEQLRRLGYAGLASVLADEHPLRPGLTPLRARDVLLVLTGPQLFVQYTRGLGWSTQELAGWITTVVLGQVFGLRYIAHDSSRTGQSAAEGVRSPPRPATPGPGSRGSAGRAAGDAP